MSAKVLIVDDERVFARAVEKRLSRAGYRCRSVATLAEAETELNDWRPELLLLDMRLPDGSGLDFLARLRAGRHAAVGVIVLTAFSEIEDAVAAMKQQALDYLRKPVDLDELLAAVAAAAGRPAPAAAPAGLLGDSPPLRELRARIAQIGELAARVDEPPTVLIQGETGTGKDVVARALHADGVRAERPFVHVDCASLPRELIEAELFGHEAGAFTGAQGARTGLLEAAGAGTVFLDEIGELSLELQAKLLAVLERRTLRRLGSSVERPLPAWFIAATNRPLQRMVAAGQFRADLYYRLKILTLELPPLRERGRDVLLLAEHYARRTAAQYRLPQPRLDASARAALVAYSWPGNVRELAHLIERAVLLQPGAALAESDLQLGAAAEGGGLATAEEKKPASGGALASQEEQLIRGALAETDGNVSMAARRLGVTRMTLRYRMQKYRIER